MRTAVMHPNVSISIRDGRGFLTVISDDQVTETELTKDQLSALSGEALKKSIALAMM